MAPRLRLMMSQSLCCHSLQRLKPRRTHQVCQAKTAAIANTLVLYVCQTMTIAKVDTRYVRLEPKCMQIHYFNFIITNAAIFATRSFPMGRGDILQQ